MGHHENILSAIGNTPLVRLSKLGRNVKPTILCKLEFLNPGGSIKDRIGVSMLIAAEKDGRIKKGGTVVEPSSGNTGVGLALACIILGFNLIVTMPDKMSDEKRRLLEAYGAKVVVCPSDRPPSHPEQYISVAKRISEENPNSFMPNQYENQINPLTHYQTTGKEIWEQTEREDHAFHRGNRNRRDDQRCGAVFEGKKCQCESNRRRSSRFTVLLQVEQKRETRSSPVQDRRNRRGFHSVHSRL